MQYYIAVGEWNYPTESGRIIIDDFNRAIGMEGTDSDDTDCVRSLAKEKCENELASFCDNIEKNAKIVEYDASTAHNNNMFEGEFGCRVECDEEPIFYYAVRVIPVSSLESPFDKSKRI